jgi:hypothetical protein
MQMRHEIPALDPLRWDFTCVQEATRRAFWRASASCLAIALRYRQPLARMLPYIPYALAGTVAFILGRVVGIMALA